MTTDILHIALDETVSTSTYLKRYTHGGSEPYVLCTAEYQTAGRGQRGNTWESDRGLNLLFTLAHYSPPLPPTAQFTLSEATSLAILDALRSLLPAEANRFSIKWPNDIFWCDRKLAGILIEHELTATRILRTLIGVGLNVNQSAFHSDAPNPVSLFQITGTAYSREPLLEHVLEAYKQRIMLPAAVLDDAYHHSLYRRGLKARYRDSEGMFEGIIEGVEADGRLRILKDNGDLQHYAFKEVSYII